MTRYTQLFQESSLLEEGLKDSIKSAIDKWKKDKQMPSIPEGIAKVISKLSKPILAKIVQKAEEVLETKKSELAKVMDPKVFEAALKKVKKYVGNTPVKESVSITENYEDELVQTVWLILFGSLAVLGVGALMISAMR
jgi:Ribonuclease G/E